MTCVVDMYAFKLSRALKVVIDREGPELIASTHKGIAVGDGEVPFRYPSPYLPWLCGRQGWGREQTQKCMIGYYWIGRSPK